MNHLHRGKERVYDIAEMVGPYTWAALHHLVETFPCPPCAETGGRLMRGFHDLINAHLGKPLFAPEDFLFLQEAMNDVVVETNAPPPIDAASIEAEVRRLAIDAGVMTGREYPSCGPGQAQKFERCVKRNKEDGNPYAVCTISVGCSPHA